MHRTSRLLATLLLVVVPWGTPLLRAEERVRPPMVDPALDEDGQPFCYFSRPTDQLGVMDGEHGFQVTAEGWLYTRRFEVLFLAGRALETVQQRIRTLRDGHLPILEYAVSRDDVRYDWTLFAATLDGDPRSPLFAFVRIQARNLGTKMAQAALGVALRHRGPSWGTARMRADRASPFRFRSEYAVSNGAVTRDGRALLFLPSPLGNDGTLPVIGATLEEPYGGPFCGADHAVLPTTPVCPVTWGWSLAPGETQHVDLAVPLVPVPEGEIVAVRAKVQGRFDAFLARTLDTWNALFERAMTLEIPEKKAHDTFWTCFANVAIARDQVEEDVWVQRVNELQYHTGFWPRDASYFCMAWWYLGLPEEGRRVVDHYFRIQNPDGSFQHDPENISPFTLARWYQLTGDRDYAKHAFPYLWRNYEWLKRQRRSDPLHLMPRRGRYDNEAIDGHYTGHNFYNLCALREGARMAGDLGLDDERRALEAEHRDYRRTFLQRLKPLVKKHGFIPPGLDTGTEGAQWGNLVGSYPTEVLAADHEWIAKTSDKLRREMYEEGLLVYHTSHWWSLHHYSTIKNTYADLLRGRDDLVVRDLYSLLTHTSASNAGFEFCITGWSNRDFGGNFSPHGWFAAKLIGLVRLMLVREDHDDLHFLSALPPAWVAPGKRLVAKDVLTRLGRIGFAIEGTDEGLRLELDPLPEVKGRDRRLLVTVPWYATLQEARADGKRIGTGGRELVLPWTTRVVELDFERDPAARTLDYAHAVEAWKDEYAARFEAWRNAHPDTAPFAPFPETAFASFAERREEAASYAAREGFGIGARVTATSAAEGHPATLVTDGVDGATSRWWEPLEADRRPSLSIDLGEKRRVGRIVLQTAERSPPLRFQVLALEGDGAPRLLYDGRSNDLPARGGAYELFLVPTATRGLRIVVDGASKPRLTEVRVFEKPRAWQEARIGARGRPDNLARGARTISSEWEGDDAPWKAVDGKRSWGDGFWAGAVGPPQWWMVDLGEPREIGRARLYFYAGDDRAYAWVLQSSLDGTSWRSLAEHREPLDATGEGTQVRFEPHPARYLRVVVLENTANPAAHIAEFEVYAR